MHTGGNVEHPVGVQATEARWPRLLTRERFKTGRKLKSISIILVEKTMSQAYELGNRDEARIRQANWKARGSGQ